MKRLFMIGIIAFLILCTTHSATAETRTFVTREQVNEVAREMYPPGTTDPMTADYAPTEQGEKMRQEIARMLQEGKSKEEIIRFYVDRYGDRVLASPQKKGFMLSAWVLPVLVILSAFLALYSVLRKWVRNAQSRVSKIHRQPQKLTFDDQRIIEDEFRRFIR
jgi:cytochrome c-type biogenesis protein CcmH